MPPRSNPKPKATGGGSRPGPARGGPGGGGAGRGGGGIGLASTPSAGHITTVGVRRPGYGSGGNEVDVLINAYPVTIPQANIHHYDVIEPDVARRIKVLLVRQLQDAVAPEVFSPKVAYDGEKNIFAARELSIGSGRFDVSLPNPRASSRPPKVYQIRLTKVQTINPELLQRFSEGTQSQDNAVQTAITALNVVVRMAPLDLAANPASTSKTNYAFDARSIYVNNEVKAIGGGIELWRGYFQSIRPSIGRMIINVDIATATMYKPGPLISLILEFLGQNNVSVLAPNQLQERQRSSISRFLSGLEIITPHTETGREKGKERPKKIKKATREGADALMFTDKEGKQVSVASYFRKLNMPLRYPNLFCVDVGRGGAIPLELCVVPPGRIMKKEVPTELKKAVLDFATKKPKERLQSIEQGLPVLRYTQSEYIGQFGMQINTSGGPLRVKARVLAPPALLYNPKSRVKKVVPRDGAWNMVDKQFYDPKRINRWVIVVYSPKQRFNDTHVANMVQGLQAAASKVGMVIEEKNPICRWENGQANIGQQLLNAGKACFDKNNKAGGPDLIIAVLPDNVQDFYNAVKHFGDIKQGVATQCLRSSKAFRANEQYWMNVLLKVNVKLGGMNLIPEATPVSPIQSIPTLIIGADVAHPPPGLEEAASYTSVVGNVDSNAVRYIANIQVQKGRVEIIEDLKEMVKYLITSYKSYQGAVEKKPPTSGPKRIIFYRDGVSEGQFQHVLDQELPMIKAACEETKTDAKITLIIVGKRHHIRFIPVNAQLTDDARRGNCAAGTVIDRGIGHPTEFDYYLLSHGALLGTSRPSHYSVLYDENRFTADSIHALSFALCHVYARATRSVSIPAPVYYADIVCARAKIHFDPSSVEASETGTLDSSQLASALEAKKKAFRPLHPTQANRMYFS
ncbi:argonaute-like protein [Pluteus cervinus]|uniref:Argonaute-like protein n=1 Tax=Pluteus cervinus TaxID=181527 RepID=A0ACD3AUC0_9AGAR|nr:argonaute-like protein [Pluteus cervinus]